MRMMRIRMMLRNMRGEFRNHDDEDDDDEDDEGMDDDEDDEGGVSES